VRKGVAERRKAPVQERLGQLCPGAFSEASSSSEIELMQNR
jgi:hypothetical protein